MLYAATICATIMAFRTDFVIAAASPTISTNKTQKYAWSSSVGWINCRTDDTNGMVVGQYVCSGFMYSPTAGWISLGNGSPSSGIHYATNSATDYGVNHDGEGHLSGYAWCPSAGWINFGWTNATDAMAPKVDLATGILSGYAWGTGVGWISLSNMSAYVKTMTLSRGSTASNTNGIPDAWVLQSFPSTGTNGFSASADSDTDGVSNADEYLAGTDPMNKDDTFNVRKVSFSGTSLQLNWSSKQIRNYRIEVKSNLMDAAWVDSGLGIITADTSTNTVRSIPVNTQGFFRIRAALPLQ